MQQRDPQAPILLLKEETDARFGKSQIISNIEACEKVAGMLKTTLGPNGMDKLFFNGTDLLITNDGATIMRSLEITHPAARILCNISESQDKDIGDGTTSVVLFAAAIMSGVKTLVKENFPVVKIAEALEKTYLFLEEKIAEQKIPFSRESLHMLAETSLNSKILSGHKKHFGEMVVRALQTVGPSRVGEIGIKKVPGGGIDSSFLVEGVAFEKCFTYAGYEQQPKKIKNAKIAFLNVELEWKSEAENAEMRISGVEEYQRVVDAEWKIITDKLDRIIDSGANVVLSILPVGDYATQHFAKHGVFSAGRVPEAEVHRLIKSFGGRVVSTVGLLESSILGECGSFEELEIGRTKFNFFRRPLGNTEDDGPEGEKGGEKEGEAAKSCTLILRGPGMEILSEVERSLHDSLMVTKRAMVYDDVVSGGGAFEMEMSRALRLFSAKFSCGTKFVVKAVSEAFETIPFQLARNFGFDAISTLQLLRKFHHEGMKTHGVSEQGVADTQSLFILEPLEIKRNMIKAAVNAAIAIVSVDATIISPQRKDN